MSFEEGSELVLLLRQLEEEGFAELNSDGAALSWSNYYTLLESPEHCGALGLLGLPGQKAWKPILSSNGTLTDANFAVSIQGWLDPHGQRPNGNVGIEGAVLTAGGKSAILPEAAWRMAQAIAEQRSRKADERTPDVNKRDWSTIRGHASRAGADLTDYLRKTVVLTPERLRIDLRKGDVIGDKLVEVMPGFDGAPPRWLELFDRFDTVPERYEIPDGNGLVHVLLSEEARTVLREIRRMPGRRIAGERAEAFVRNPFATLGPDAAKVIDPEQFERAREDAGIVFASFTAKVLRDDKSTPYDVSLIVEETLRGAVRAEELKFEGPVALDAFLKKLDGKMAAGAQCCHWQGFDLEILGDTPAQAALLRGALSDWRRPSLISAADIFDLSKYSERVGGFGVEKPYYSPFIARKSEDAGWFPENVDLGLCFEPEGGGETVAIALDDRNLKSFRAELDKARQEKRETFAFPGCPKPVPVAWAVDALETLGHVREDVSKGTFDPKKATAKGRASERKGLVVKPNVDALDYEERRGVLSTPMEPAALPSAMLSHIELKEHQLDGVAWLQHLWRHSPTACRGALLADDMGLGKTIQLLTFMAAAIERETGIDPFLVVAPVSLLENWKEEIAKFFAPDAMKVLTLYGPDLASKRVPKSALDEGLVEAGSPKLLSSGWLGSANVVLTTYETLRDLEFSLAAQRWSAVICDEAQKIKNPNALVTRAAKKQNARLKIACTGTPVENNHVIHFTRTWNPAKEDQATDRAYRIGQERNVYVYYPVVVAHDFLTFDAKLDTLLNKKRALSTDMLNGAGDVSPADFGDLEAPDGGNAFSNESLTVDDIGALDGDAFEAFCALLWTKMGYARTIKTKRVGDGGVDVVAIKRSEGALIQCKSSTVEDKELGWEGVRDVAAGRASYAARYPGITFSMVAVTNRRFNQAARHQAGVLNVELIEGDHLAEMLALHPMKRGELERFLLAGWGAV